MLNSTSFGFLLMHITWSSTPFIVEYWQHSSCKIGVHFSWLHCISVLHYIGAHFKRNIYHCYIWIISSLTNIHVYTVISCFCKKKKKYVAIYGALHMLSPLFTSVIGSKFVQKYVFICFSKKWQKIFCIN